MIGREIQPWREGGPCGGGGGVGNARVGLRGGGDDGHVDQGTADFARRHRDAHGHQGGLVGAQRHHHRAEQRGLPLAAGEIEREGVGTVAGVGQGVYMGVGAARGYRRHAVGREHDPADEGGRGDVGGGVRESTGLGGGRERSGVDQPAGARRYIYPHVHRDSLTGVQVMHTNVEQRSPALAAVECEIEGIRAGAAVGQPVGVGQRCRRHHRLGVIQRQRRARVVGRRRRVGHPG